MTRIALAGATVYRDPFEPPLRDGVILIENGTITAVRSRASTEIPDGAETLDCSGCTAIAGFWNSHVHFFERKWANAAAIPADELQQQLEDAFTRFGFTTVFDTGSAWENTRIIRDRIASGEVRGPAILSTGEALLPPGAMPSSQVLAALGYVAFPAPEISDAQQGAEAAAKLLAAGTDGMKIFPSAPRSAPIAPEAISAAANVVRAAGKPVFAHPDTNDDVRIALENGVNVIAHTTPRSGSWDDELIALMKQRGAALTPTLMLWQTLMRHDSISVQDGLVETAVAQLGAWHAAGGCTLFGTDLGATDPNPAREYELMEKAGMNLSAIVASLTSVPSSFFGKASCGSILAGYQADLVLLSSGAEFRRDMLTRVKLVLRSGQVVFGSA